MAKTEQERFAALLSGVLDLTAAMDFDTTPEEQLREYLLEKPELRPWIRKQFELAISDTDKSAIEIATQICGVRIRTEAAAKKHLDDIYSIICETPESL